MEVYVTALRDLVNNSGFSVLFSSMGTGNVVMLLVALVLLYLAIGRGFEPLLLVPIAFGCLLVNLPLSGIMSDAEGSVGFLRYVYFGAQHEIYPIIIFLGIGALTDFGPLLANPVTFLLGAAAQFGVFVAFIGANWVGPIAARFGLDIGFNIKQAASIAIIGGADGPTSIYLTMKLGQQAILGAIAVAAYSYMSLVPLIQPPVIKLLTTKKDRAIRMGQLRPVSRREKILFPIICTIVTGLILPASVPLVGMLMFGNLLRECGATDRLSLAAQNEILNITTIFLGLAVGSTMEAQYFLQPRTLVIILLGLVAFIFSTVGGVGVRRANGGPCGPACLAVREPGQLPPDARHGPQRRRGHRYGRRGGGHADAFVLTPPDGRGMTSSQDRGLWPRSWVFIVPLPCFLSCIGCPAIYSV